MSLPCRRTNLSVNLPLLFWILAVSYCSPAAMAEDRPEAARNYESALRRLKKGDLKIDFKSLRMNCVESRRSCEADSDDKNKIMSLIKEKNHVQALKEVDQNLDDGDLFVDIDLHFMAHIANTELGNRQKADFHKAVVRGLLDSIQENKRGRSEEDAFVVINVHEEYVFLRFRNLTAKKQSLIRKNGHSYDVMECVDVDEQDAVKLFFNVDIPVSRLNESIKQGPNPRP